MKVTPTSCSGLLALLLAVVLQAVTAQDRDLQYVTDKLRLSLYSQANDSSNVIKLLQSGDGLEIEQIQGPYAFVVTEDGTRGWVKRGFLVEEPTSNLLLEQALGQIDALEAELDKLANSKVVLDQYEADMNQMATTLQSVEQEKAAAVEALKELERQQAEAEAERLAAERAEEGIASAGLVATAEVDLREIGQFALEHWKLLAPLLALLVVIVFLISKVIIEARIRSRFHGIKIW